MTGSLYPLDALRFMMCWFMCIYFFICTFLLCAGPSVKTPHLAIYMTIRRASSSFSCLPSGAAFAINALYTLYRKIPYMSNFILSYPQLVAWRLKLVFFFYFRMQLRIILKWLPVIVERPLRPSWVDQHPSHNDQGSASSEDDARSVVWHWICPLRVSQF